MKFFDLFGRRNRITEPTATGPRKWLPIIDTDSCGGCGKCVEACESDCIDLVWAFATLTRADACGSSARCAEVCPEAVIRMAWVELDGDVTRGRWNATGSSDENPS